MNKFQFLLHIVLDVITSRTLCLNRQHTQSLELSSFLLKTELYQSMFLTEHVLCSEFVRTSQDCLISHFCVVLEPGRSSV